MCSRGPLLSSVSSQLEIKNNQKNSEIVRKYTSAPEVRIRKLSSYDSGVRVISIHMVDSTIFEYAESGREE